MPCIDLAANASQYVDELHAYKIELAQITPMETVRVTRTPAQSTLSARALIPSTLV